MVLVFGLVASATRPGKCAYHEFWIPVSPGAMILDSNCFWEFEGLFCEWVLVCCLRIVFGCKRVLFAYFVIAVWVCICLVLSLRRQDQANVPVMNFGYRFRPGP